MERRLAAILIADVVGYGRLSQIDEEGTRRRFRSDLEEVFQPGFAAHRGRLVKTMGDGLLVEFQSVVDAVRCAVAIQRQLQERHAGTSPGIRLAYRMGINLGDIIVEDDDIQGDGVNIAARLQALAPPGGLVLSGTAFDHVKSKLEVGYSPMGLQKVKSIAEPVRVYRVDLHEAPAGPAAGRPTRRSPARTIAALAGLFALALVLGLAWWSRDPPSGGGADPPASTVSDLGPSVVVLPFDVMTDDKEQAYLANGFTEDVTTELARIPGLFVVSRNAASAYREKKAEPGEVAAALRVRYLLEGSIRRVGNDIRINVQLIDGATAGHLWAERFDGDWDDVFALQDRVVGNIAAVLKVRLVSGQAKADVAGGTRNPAAYEAHLRGQEMELGNRPADIVAAVAYYRQAFALDPDFGAAKASLAWLYWNADDQRASALGLSWEEIDSQIAELLSAAAARPSPRYYQLTAELAVRQNRSDDAIAALQKAITLDPSDPWTYEGLSNALIFNGRPAEGSTYLEAALRVDPGWTDWRRYQAGLASFGQDRYEEAVAHLDKIDLQSPDPWTKFYGMLVLLAANGHLGQTTQLEATRGRLEKVLVERNEGTPTLLLAQRYLVFKFEVDALRLLDGLSKAGVPDVSPTVTLNPSDRVGGPELKAGILGHELRGHRIDGSTVEDYRSLTLPDGSVTRSMGARTDSGKQWIQGNFMCSAFTRVPAVCAAVFRNVAGSRAGLNEFFAQHRFDRIEFSVID